MIIIDGSYGEGGGQVLRSSLTLSCITGIPFRIINIRTKRPQPGLRPQHLRCVEAAAKICDAKIEGAKIGSIEVRFLPGEIRSRSYKFDIGTAGSTSLLLQTIFLPLGLSKGRSQIQLTGGTHVPWSPCFDYLNLHWLHFMELIGFHGKLVLEEAGFYPRGGGSVYCSIKPAVELRPIEAVIRGKLLNIKGISGVSNLDPSIAKRQKHQALMHLEPIIRDIKIRSQSFPGPSIGTFLLLLAEFEHSNCCYFSLGKKGKPAEAVANETVNELLRFLDTDAAIDSYLADQLLLPLSLVNRESTISTEQITTHLVTNQEIINKFLPVKIDIEGEIGRPGLIKIKFP